MNCVHLALKATGGGVVGGITQTKATDVVLRQLLC
jgi:hypothetical protein